MCKFIFAVLLAMAPVEFIFARSCTDIFKQDSRFYALAQDLQINLLDLAEKVSVYPEHKGMNAEWSIYAVNRHGVNVEITYVTVGEIKSIVHKAQRDYAKLIRQRSFSIMKDEIWNHIWLQGHGKNHLETYLTIILKPSGYPLAAKVSFEQKGDKVDGIAPIIWSSELYLNAEGFPIRSGTSF